MPPDLQRAVARFARLAPPGSTVVVATSGGPDSQALLHLAASAAAALGWRALFALGIDHGLRPEAGAELARAARLARELDVPFAIEPVAVTRRGNLMDAARRARYRALASFAARVGADRIAVAHTATDQVESILLNLTRGAGLRGAGGIRPRRGKLIRPLLDTSRGQILDYLAAHQIPFATDPSNHDERRARALIRHRVLPVLRQLNPRLETAFARFGAQARADERLLARLARRDLEARLGPLDSLAVAGLPTPAPLGSRLLKAWLQRHGLDAGRDTLARLHRLASGRPGSLSVAGRTIRLEAGRLWVDAEAPYDLLLTVPGRLRLERLGITVVAAPLETTARRGPRLPENDRDMVAIALPGPHLPLRVRTVVPGDRMQPFGNRGRIKVGDLFTNAKIPRALRRAWPLVVAGDSILWAVGLRRGAGFPVQPRARGAVAVRVEGAIPWQPC
ncbi:MAG: tRNA lysidine(34) synthetase TilS [Deltaproteobacteria bacterium]|nr:tRNA lysidine(34) synthetase TilS [Deltaproteobacteria bacterium]